jgi:DNA polymerase elongation subunit (family B)
VSDTPKLTELTIDIETMPPDLEEEELREIAALKLPRTIKKADSIEKWVSDFAAKGKQYERLSLDTLFADIVSIAVKKGDGQTVCWVADDDAEMRPIDYFARTLADVIESGPFVLIGHNIIAFDAPILWRHLKANGYHQLAAAIRPAGKYRSSQYYDTMLQYPGDRMHGLKLLAVANGWPVVDGFSGAAVYQAWLDKEYQAIEEYNINDVELTWKLYEYLSGG